MHLTPEQADAGTILKVLAGSHIHGLNTPTSDRDEDAIVVEPLEAAWGLGQPWEDTDRIGVEGQPDQKWFSLRKWCRMAANGNPNFLLMLFAPPQNILHQNALGTQLRDMRDLFISQQCIRSHLGYMKGQRTRLVNHQREFGAGGGHGKPRFDLIEQFGYDTKFGMHLIRLGCQGVEIATSGTVTLPMAEPLRSQLMEIREGKLELNHILGWAADLEARMEGALRSSTLPETPNLPAIEAWMQKTYIRMWSAQRKLQDMIEDQDVFGIVH